MVVLNRRRNDRPWPTLQCPSASMLRTRAAHLQFEISTQQFAICRACFAVLLVVWLVSATVADDSSDSIYFERDIWPTLATNCVGCHGMEDPKGGLDLRTVTSIRRGGESGPAI